MSEIADGFLSFCNWVEGGVQILDDIYGESLDPGRSRVYLMVRRKLLVQPKVELAHPVVPGVFCPHEANFWLMEHIYIAPPRASRGGFSLQIKVWSVHDQKKSGGMGPCPRRIGDLGRPVFSHRTGAIASRHMYPS